MRCLTLAHELRHRDVRCAFVVGPDSLETVPALANSGFEVQIITSSQSFRQMLGAFMPDEIDLIVFDHYGVSRDAELDVAHLAGRLMVIDDLADRPHRCDLLLDQTINRSAHDYTRLVNADCRLLLGGAFAMLRPEFIEIAPMAAARRALRQRPAGLLVSMGLTDVGATTAAILEAIGPADPFAVIDVLLAREAPSRSQAEARARVDRRIHLHDTKADVAALMAKADVAIGAAGSTSWERCCLGLPTVLLKLASNQAKIAGELVQRGAALLAEGPRQAVRLAVDLVHDPASLKAMSLSAAALIDGKGVLRVADAIEALF